MGRVERKRIIHDGGDDDHFPWMVGYSCCRRWFLWCLDIGVSEFGTKDWDRVACPFNGERRKQFGKERVHFDFFCSFFLLFIAACTKDDASALTYF